MNDIILKTNSNEYAGGNIIYGVVYLHLLEPVVADTITMCVSGRERCKWNRIVSALGQTIVRSRSTSKESTDTGFCDMSGGNEANTPDVQLKEVVFVGEFNHLKHEFKLAEFKEGTIPLGCYAFPFQYTLKQGLPNSFKRVSTYDEIKRAAYEAEICYTITAKLQSSLSRCESELQSCQEIKLRQEDFMKREGTPFNKTIKEPVKVCFCFPKGEITLKVHLEKVFFTLGETIGVKFDVENRTSSVKISTARIKLMKTMNIKGKRCEKGDVTYEGNEAFPETEQAIIPLEMANCKHKSFNIPMLLKKSGNEMLATSTGTVVKYRYHLEVELDVPLDKDVSVVVPIQVYPCATESWDEWEPPVWIQDVKVHPVKEFCAVPPHILESTEFAKLPLPLSGLGST